MIVTCQFLSTNPFFVPGMQGLPGTCIYCRPECGWLAHHHAQVNETVKMGVILHLGTQVTRNGPSS